MPFFFARRINFVSIGSNTTSTANLIFLSLIIFFVVDNKNSLSLGVVLIITSKFKTFFVTLSRKKISKSSASFFAREGFLFVKKIPLSNSFNAKIIARAVPPAPTINIREF